MINSINYFEAVPIKELSHRLRMNEQTLLNKIPEKFKLRIGKSVRYDLNAIVEYFRSNENYHEQLIDNLLK